LRRFKVVKCPRCSLLQLTTASRSVRCRGCGQAWSLGPDSILFTSSDLERARSFLLRMKQGGGVEFKRASEL